MKKLLLIITTALLLAGCAPGSKSTVDNHMFEHVKIAPYTYRIVDSYWNVVCYEYTVSTQAAISCVPLSATGLDF